MFEANDGFIVFLLFAVAVPHLFVGIHFHDDILSRMSTVPQLIVEVISQSVLLIHKEDLRKHGIDFHNEVVLSDNNSEEPNCHT